MARPVLQLLDMTHAGASARAIAAVLVLSPFTGACGGPSRPALVLSAEEVRAVRALPAAARTELHVGADTVHTGEQVTVVEGTDSTSRFTPPIPLRSALEEADAQGDVRVVFGSEPSDSSATVVEVGSYSALAGGGIAGVGFLIMLGAAAMGGPTYDHSDVIRGGGVTFLIGTGVAALGGLTALAGYVAGYPQTRGHPR